MRIIKEGLPEKYKAKMIFTCDSCKCEFEYDKKIQQQLVISIVSILLNVLGVENFT